MTAYERIDMYRKVRTRKCAVCGSTKQLKVVRCTYWCVKCIQRVTTHPANRRN